MTRYIETTDLSELLDVVMENVLGFESKEILIDTLEQDFGIRAYSGGAIFLDELEGAFMDLFGEQASSLIMDLMHEEAEKMRIQRMYR